MIVTLYLLFVYNLDTQVMELYWFGGGGGGMEEKIPINKGCILSNSPSFPLQSYLARILDALPAAGSAASILIFVFESEKDFAK